MRFVLGVCVAGLLLFPRTSLAQGAPAPPESPRFFIDINPFGVAWTASHDREFFGTFAKFGEIATFEADYPKPSMGFAFLDVGGGFLLKPNLGFGAMLVRTTYKDTADVFATIPHPVFLNAAATDGAVTDRELQRNETAVHFGMFWIPLRGEHRQLRFFLGGSYFFLDAEMVNDISYEQTFSQTTPQNSVTVTGFTSERAKGGGFGAHISMDYTYFFNRTFGVGGGLRLSRGNVSLKPEPLSGIDQEIRVGGANVFVGIRLRFGH